MLFASGVNAAGAPFVHFLLDDQLVAQLDVGECREVGANAFGCAEAAEHDAMVAAWLRGKMGVPVEGVAAAIADLRKYRGDTTASTVTAQEAREAQEAQEAQEAGPGSVAVGGEGIYYPSRARGDLLEPGKAGAHVWTVVTTHVVSDETATAAHGGGRVDLDAENLAAIATGCYACEQAYSPELAAQPCEGEPS